MIRHTLLSIALAGLVACAGSDGADGAAGQNGAAGASSLVTITEEPAGANCANGGHRVDVGLDDNGDGALGTEEIDDTSYICNGSDAGPRTLVTSTAEPAGANCANGGQRLDVGSDDDGDNVLDPEEIETTSYVCNGVDAVDHLVDVTTEAPGGNCPTGGQRIDHGLDANSNNVLDAAEISGTSYVCNGSNGSIVNVTDEPPGANCQAGGSQIDFGIDDNGNGMLEAGEIDGTRYVCHGTLSGFQVFTASGTFTPPAGVTSVRALVVGGGGGGPGSHYNGGGSGHVRIGTFNVSSPVSITVGTGGVGGQPGNEFPGTNGGSSSFGAFLTAPGGRGGWDVQRDTTAGNGGSGGGGSGNSGAGGNGGTAGSNGTNGATYRGSIGGNFDSLVNFAVADVTAGAGGAAGMSTHGGGGGGGGVLIDGVGGPGANGAATFSARGGAGYGGGGGAGGYNAGNGYAVGGNGASGVVYVEW